jgi:hypothetical protein
VICDNGARDRTIDAFSDDDLRSSPAQRQTGQREERHPGALPKRQGGVFPYYQKSDRV